MRKDYVVEIRLLEDDTVEQTSRRGSLRSTERLEQAYDSRIDHAKYYCIVVEVQV